MRNSVLSCNRLALRLQRVFVLACLLLSAAACARQLDDAPTALSDAPSHPTHSEKSVDAGLAKSQATAGSKGDESSAAAAKPSAQASSGADAKAQPKDSEAAGTPAAAGAGSAAAISGDAGPATDAASEAAAGPPKCEPRAGTYVVLEGHKLSFSLSCGIAGVTPDTWELDSLPAGASFDETTGALSWQPGLDQAASYKITAKAMPWAEATSVEIFVVDAFDAAGNEPPTDPTKYLEEYGLPVLHLTTDPGVNDDEYTPATIVYRGHTYSGSEAKFRGATSRQYPKRSFTLKFTKEDKFNEPTLAGGFLKKRKITLVTSFDDNSYVRQRLGYELWNQLDPSGHIHVQSYSAVVYLNGKYHGLYTVADHVDGYLMEDFGYDQEGNLYKARDYDGNFKDSSGVNFVDGKAQPKKTLHDGYTKEEGTPEEGQPGAFDDLDALVDWAAHSSAADFAAQIDTKLARKEYEDWWIWSSFIAAADSAGKNSYHYHDPLLASSVWHIVPWDLNASFGQDWQTLRTAAKESPPDAWYRSVNGLFDRMLSDASLGPALEKRYGVELAGPLASSKALALVDAMVKEIEQSALRDEQKWQSAYRSYPLWKARTDFTSYHEEIAYVRRWIEEREDYLEGIY